MNGCKQVVISIYGSLAMVNTRLMGLNGYFFSSVIDYVLENTFILQHLWWHFTFPHFMMGKGFKCIRMIIDFLLHLNLFVDDSNFVGFISDNLTKTWPENLGVKIFFFLNFISTCPVYYTKEVNCIWNTRFSKIRYPEMYKKENDALVIC